MTWRRFVALVEIELAKKGVDPDREEVHIESIHYSVLPIRVEVKHPSDGCSVKIF